MTRGQRYFRGAWVRTLLFSVGMRTRQVRLYPEVQASWSETASVIGDGRLELGVPWDGLPCRPGGIRLGEGATLELQGGMTLHTDVHVSVAPGARLFLGSGYINSGLRLDCFHSIRIGFSVAIGPDVFIRDSDNHSLDGKSMTAPVVIGDHVWIGAKAMILKGVTVGDGAVIAAGSVVTRDIPPGAFAAGVPARVVREGVTWT